jgi:zinc transport system substrate-binding protein
MRWNSAVSASGLAILASGLLIAGCASRDEGATSGTGREGPPTVYVDNYQLQYFAQRIGGDRIRVVFPAPPDIDPAYWSPDADAVLGFQQADLILLNGAGYATWRDKVTLPDAKLRDTSASFKDQWIEITDAVTHTHGPAGEHAHRGTAFTTWLDPRLASSQAQSVADALGELLPADKAVFEQNLKALQADLAELDGQLNDIFARRPQMPVVFSHPVYQYLTRRYQLNGRSVHWEPDEVPTAPMLAELDELLRTHPARWMIWEGQPDQATVVELAKRDVSCVVFEPCGNAPEEGDFLSVMRRNVANLENVY